MDYLHDIQSNLSIMTTHSDMKSGLHQQVVAYYRYNLTQIHLMSQTCVKGCLLSIIIETRLIDERIQYSLYQIDQLARDYVCHPFHSVSGSERHVGGLKDVFS